VLGRSELERIAAGCPSGQPPLIVDLSVPPDVDPRAVGEVDVEYLSIDEINEEAAATRQRRLLELGPAREVIDEALDALRVRLAERILSPAIARLNQRYRHTASEGLERLFRRELRGIDDEARRAITQWAEVLARRLAHVPVMGLRGLAARGGAPAVRAFLEASGEDCFADVLEVAERLEAFDDANERETEP
jgi:glutamyl-tRNA reductase